MPSPDPPSYKSHPLYSFRHSIILNAVIGSVLHIIALSCTRSYALWVWVFGIILLLISAAIAFFDLFIWVHQKYDREVARMQRGGTICSGCRGAMPSASGPPDLLSQMCHGVNQGSGNTTFVQHSRDSNTGFRKSDDDDDQPKWPVKKIMVCDFLITGLLAWIFICQVANAPGQGYYYDNSGPGTVLRAWATIPTFFAMILHARCWWRAFRAREKASWLKELGIGSRISEYRDDDVEAMRGPDANTSLREEPHDGQVGAFGGTIPNQFGSFRNMVGEVVQGLNCQARKALASKLKPGLSQNSDAWERESLLPHSTCPHHKYAQDMHNHGTMKVPADSNAQWHGTADKSASAECTCGNAQPLDGTSIFRPVNGIAIDPVVSYLTPSDSDVTSSGTNSDASMTSHDIWKVRNSNAGIAGKSGDARRTLHGSEVGGHDLAAKTYSKFQPGNPVTVENVQEDYDDSNIMVVKKTRKEKGKKSKAREVEIEEE